MWWLRPSKRSVTPWCSSPSRCIRSPSPASLRMSTVPCSSTPARIRCSTYSRLRVSSTTDSIPARCSRCDSSSPAGPAPTMPTWVRASLAVIATEYARRDAESSVGGRRAAIDRGLQQNLLDLVGAQPVAPRAGQVQRQLLVMTERHQRGQGDGAAHPPVEPGPRPDLPPGIAGDQILKVRGQVGRGGESSIDMLVTQHLTPYPQTRFPPAGSIVRHSQLPIDAPPSPPPPPPDAPRSPDE